MLEIRPTRIPFRMILSLSIRDPLIARLAPGRERHTPTPGIRQWITSFQSHLPQFALFRR